MIYRVLILLLLAHGLSLITASAAEDATLTHPHHACFVYDGTEDGVLLEAPLNIQIGASTGTFFGTLEQLEEYRAERRAGRQQFIEDHPEAAKSSVFHTDYQLPPTPIYSGTFVEFLSEGEVFCRPLAENESEAGVRYYMDQILVRPGGNDHQQAQPLFRQEWYVSDRPRGFVVYFTEEEMHESGIVFFPFNAELGRLESFTPVEPSAAQLSAAHAKITSQTLK